MIQVCSKCGNLVFLNDNFTLLPPSLSINQELYALRTSSKCNVYTCNGNLISLNGVESVIGGMDFIMALRQIPQFLGLAIISTEEMIKRCGLSFTVKASYKNSAKESILNFVNRFLDVDLEFFNKGVISVDITSPEYDSDMFELSYAFKGYSQITNVPSMDMYLKITNIANNSYNFAIEVLELLDIIEKEGDTPEVTAKEQEFLDRVIRKDKTKEETKEEKETPDTTQEEEKETQEEAAEKAAEEPKDNNEEAQEETIERPKNNRKPMTMVPKEKFYEAFDKGYTEEQILEEFGVSKQTYTRRKNEWLAKHSENINSAQEEPKKEKPEASASGYQWKKFKPEED